MKKLILSIVAVVALFSCSKSDIIYTEQEAHIGFSPIANTIVKSVANSNNTENFAYPTNLDLYVFANAQADDLSQSWPSPYFTNAKFIYNRLNNVYEGDPARYWPNVKSLIFAGYSGNVGTLSTDPTMDFDNNVLTIKDYIQDNTNGYTSSGNSITSVVGGNDLMWFSKTAAYTKQATAIPVTMQHACSWITVKVVGDAVTGGKWILNELRINNLVHNSTKVELGESAATWTLPSQPTLTDEVVYSNGTTAIPTVATGAQIYENVADNMIVIPQVPTTIDVTYSFVPQTGIDPITETKTGLSLSIGKETIDGEECEKLWESGKHYIYTITITATEILIDPKVDVWSPHTVTPGTTI